MNSQEIKTVDEMLFTLTMRDGSKKLVRFKLKDATAENDKLSLELFCQTTKRSDFPCPTNTYRQATLTFNYEAFEIEIT